MLNKFSEELKEARIKNELTLQQIAVKTRIDLKFLENLENGNFAFLPELYIKAFIREYSNLVGLDEKITLKKFDAAKRGKPYDEQGVTEEDVKKIKQEKDEIKPPKNKGEAASYSPTYEAYDSSNQQPAPVSGSSKNKNLFTAVAVGIVVVFAIVYFVFLKGNSDIIVSEKPYEQVQKDNEERYAAETPKPAVSDSVSVSVSRPDSLSLVVQAKEASWIRILVDGTKTEEFTLFPNTHLEVKALKNYKMTIGNAGAVQIKLNNKLLNFSGNKNEVKYVSIDSTGLQYLSPSPNP
jgi:cytoskeletal protein RodZ